VVCSDSGRAQREKSGLEPGPGGGERQRREGDAGEDGARQGQRPQAGAGQARLGGAAAAPVGAGELGDLEQAPSTCRAISATQAMKLSL
jgi:hypothetical protein